MKWILKKKKLTCKQQPYCRQMKEEHVMWQKTDILNDVIKSCPKTKKKHQANLSWQAWRKFCLKFICKSKPLTKEDYYKIQYYC